MQESYCPLPWIGLNIIPGYVSPCGQWQGRPELISDIKGTNFSADSALFENTRSLMLRNEIVPGCEQCRLAEASGAKSRRLIAIESFGRPYKIETKTLDISFDNLCNLKCRGCASTSSHLWHSDELEIYGKSYFGSKYVEQNIELDVDGLEYINVSGGEPFLSKKFETFIKKLKEKNLLGKISLQVSTNGTTKPTKEIYQAFLEAKSLLIVVSIDGIGKLNDFFRSGSNFQECLSFINFLLDLKKVRADKITRIRTNTTVSIYNVNLLDKIEDLLKNNFPDLEQQHRILYWPEQLSIRNLSKDYKDKLIPIVSTFGDKYTDVLNELNFQGEDHFEHFINYHNKLNALRKENFEECNNMLQDYISNYKTKNIDSKVFFLKQMNMLVEEQ